MGTVVKRIMAVMLIAALVLTSSFVVGVNSQNVAAAKKHKYKKFVYVKYKGGAKIVKYKGKATKVKIPKKLKKLKVKAIGKGAFRGKFKIKKISMPKTVKKIEAYAFDGCSNLRTIKMSKSITHIGKGAFFGCTRLKKIAIPAKVKYIGAGAFFCNRKLKKVTVPAKTKSIGEYCFAECERLKTITIKNKNLKKIPKRLCFRCHDLRNVTIKSNKINEIASRSFAECNDLKTVKISGQTNTFNSNIVIRKHAFENSGMSGAKFYCKSLEDEAFALTNEMGNVTFGKGAKKIGKNEFKNSNINKVTISSTVTDIDSTAFNGAIVKEFVVDKDNPKYSSEGGMLYNKDKTKLVAVAVETMPDGGTYKIKESVKEIGDYAITAGTNVTNIIWPAGLKRIGKSAFQGMASIEKLNLPNQLTEIGDDAFSGASEIKTLTLPASVKRIGDNAFENTDKLEKVTLNEGLESIGSKVFFDDNNITSINVPSTVKDLAGDAFASTGIEKFKVAKNNSKYMEKDGIIYSKDGKTLVSYPSNRMNISYTVSNGTTKIGSKAITYNDHLEIINFPSTVSSIADYGVYADSSIRFVKMDNANVKFGEKSLGYVEEENSSDLKTGLVMIGKSKSTVSKYAKKEDIAFATNMPKKNRNSVKLKKNKKAKFTVKYLDKSRVVYTSSNPKIATVTQKGKITAHKKGKTTVIAAIGTKYYTCKVKVTKSGKKAKVKYNSSSFKEVTKGTYKKWNKNYMKKNYKQSFTKLDNPNICIYSSDDYKAIKGVQAGGKTLKNAQKTFGSDLGSYKIINRDLSREIKRYKLHKNTVLFSGLSDLSMYTGKGSSLEDMRKSIGRKVKIPTVISTSIDHQVTAGFGTGGHHAVLEIYAPKNRVRGVYMKKMSNFPTEYELLLDKNSRFQIVDAGVRKIKLKKGFAGDDKQTVYERYLKLRYIG